MQIVTSVGVTNTIVYCIIKLTKYQDLPEMVGLVFYNEKKFLGKGTAFVIFLEKILLLRKKEVLLQKSLN